MNNLMLWMLSNGGGLFGIITALSTVIFLLFIFTFPIDEGINKINRRQKSALWIALAIIAFACIIFPITVCIINAPVSWFRGLPALEIKMMKKEILKHDKPLTIHQFYEVQYKYQDWVQINSMKNLQLDAMR